MDWDKDAIKIYLDDELLNETDSNKTINANGSNPSDSHTMCCSTSPLGDKMAVTPLIPDFPTRYEIDYVRVYQQK